MQRVLWRIAEGSLSIAGGVNSTSWGLTHPRPFPLSHIFVVILIAWFEPEFPPSLDLGSLLTFHGQKDVQPYPSLCSSVSGIFDLLISGKSASYSPPAPVPAFCEGPPWPLVRCHLSDFWVTAWCRCNGSSLEGSVRVTSKSALHVDVSTGVRFYLCACVAYEYILSVCLWADIFTVWL